jgi:polyisoprenyl-phosphate glycosyltransferase
MSAVTKPFLSVILPAYNEARSIAMTIKSIRSELQKAACDYEIIVIDDGSRDDTYEESKSLAKLYHTIKVIKLSRNFGKEGALLVGLKAATGDAIVSMDADLQHPPATIHDLIAKWQEGFKVVHAVKIDRDVDRFFNRIRATVFNRLIQYLGGINLRDSSDFMLIDRDAVDVIINDLPERERFFRGLAHWIGYKQATVGFKVHDRIDGSKSRFSLMSLVNLARIGIVSFTSAPLHIISILGVLSFCMGFVIGLDALISWAKGRAVSGYATLIITMLILCGFIMVSLGIIGEYIAKIYEEVKKRPSYIVESTFGFDSINTELGKELLTSSDQLE